MKIASFFSCAFSLQKEKNCTLAEAVHILRENGVTAVEFGAEHIKSEQLPEYLEILKNEGMSVCCVHFGTHLGSADEAIFANAVTTSLMNIDKAAEIGAEFVMILPVQLDDVADMDADRRRALERSAQGLRYIAAYAHSKNITIIIENISRLPLPFSTIDDLRYLAENVPYLKLNYDVGNFRCVSVDVLEAYEALKPHFVFSHIKDWKYVEEGGYQVLDGSRLVDEFHGKGILPMDEILARLQKDGYDGWYVIESGLPEMEAKIKNAVSLYRSYSC